MMSLNLRRLFGLRRQTPVRKTSRTGPPRGLAVENLEDRVTPSAAVAITLEGSTTLTSPEGALVELASDVTTPNGDVTYDWSVFKNGGVTPFDTGTNSTFNFTPDDNGTYVVKLTVTDLDGARDASDVTFTITNVAPTASVSTGLTTAVRSQTVSFTLGASDPSTADTAAGFTYQINWGDGTPVQTVTGLSGTVVTHAFAAEGTPTITVTAMDKDLGVSAPVSTSVTIKAVALEEDPLNPGQMVLAVGGTAKNDTIVLNPGGGKSGGIKVMIGGKSLGNFTGAGRIEVFGGDGNDNLQIAGAIRVPAWLDGGKGNDRLKGGNGADVLLGGDGNDFLDGGQGNDVMIGGAGSDRLVGGPGDDLMIGASTSFDLDQVSLNKIVQIWTGPGSTADHVADIQDGDTALISTGKSPTVIDDGVRDFLTGAAGVNWFITDSSLDRIMGNIKINFVNDVAPVGLHGANSSHGNSAGNAGGNGNSSGHGNGKK